MIRVVVLLGAPGSGKTTIGAELGRRGLRWREWEPVILERWGTREAFLRDKATALPELHREIEHWIALDATPSVIESTGLSDAPLLDRLQASGSALVAQLDVSDAEAARRVASRPQGVHLSDDPAANRRVSQAFQEQAARRAVDAVIDTEVHTADSAATEVMRFLKRVIREPGENVGDGM